MRGAARRLGVTLRALRDLVDGGLIPAHKNGQELRLRVEDLDAYRR
jgi:excisionase family DNA binding protein